MFGNMRLRLGASLLAFAMAGQSPLAAGDHQTDAAVQASACRAAHAQHEAETQALQLIAAPEMQKARADAAQRWLASWGPVSEAMRGEFPRALDELMFNAALKTVVHAARPPVMLMMINRPSQQGAVTVPGTRYGWDNTDNIYGNIPLDPRATYRLAGVMPANGTNLNLSVWTKDGTVLGNLARSEIKTDADGRFSLSMGAGAGFDIPLAANASHIMVRETLADWDKDTPVYFDVAQLSGIKPSPAPQAALAAQAAAAVSGMVDKLIGWRSSLYRKHPANVFEQPWMGLTSNGGLPNQAYSMGHFALQDDEALVFDIGLGAAEYFAFQLSDIWGTSGDFVGHVSTLTNRQSYVNADGGITYVVSLRDPGVQNWISTQGWHEGDVTLRWQQLAGTPAIRVRHVKLADLAAALSADTPRFDAAERAQQIAGRVRNPYGQWLDARCAH